MADDHQDKNLSRKRKQRSFLLSEEEKRIRKNAYAKNRREKQIYIGKAMDRWVELKSEWNIPSDEEMALKLLDGFFTSPSSSMPNLPIVIQTETCTPSVSEISVDSDKDQIFKPTGRTRTQKQLTESFCDLFKPDDINVMVEEVEYEAVIFGANNSGIDTIEFEDEDKPLQNFAGIKKIKDEDGCRECALSVKCIAFVNQIMELACLNISICLKCQSQDISIFEHFIGSALYLKWVCEKGHQCHQWCSQPVLNILLHSGDFLVCGSILTSGNNYCKVALWAEMMCLRFPSADQFHKICSTYIIPTIDTFWKDHQSEVLESLKDKDLVVLETQYPEIHHSYDIWHVAKNLGKRLLKVAQKKGNNILLDWCKDIVNHFWFSCKESESYEQFVSIWRGVLHHITNTHEWILSHGGVNHCLHEPLTVEDSNKPWLSPTAHAHVLKDLATIVLDTRLLNNVEYYLRFRSTAELEGFNQHILMYCAKRYAYTPPVYTARNRLAALDHNMNVDRPSVCNKNGEIRYHWVFNKKSGRWSVHAVKEKKNYNYVKTVLSNALNMRIDDNIGMSDTTLSGDDPLRISKHLAPPPSTKELVREKKSPFEK